MITFSEKKFGKLGKAAKKGIESIQNDPAKLIIPALTSTPGIALGLANLTVNKDRRKRDRELRQAQVDATNKLVEALENEDRAGIKRRAIKLRKAYKKPIADDQVPAALDQVKNKVLKGEDMISFKKKDFSILSDAVSGAAVGGTLGMGATPIIFKKKDKIVLGKKGSTIDLDGVGKGAVGFAAGTIIGAALGLVVGGIKETAKFINRARTVDKRLMPGIIEDLKKGNFKEGKDFTRDPKTANELKTRVCVVVTKYSGDLRILINTVSDQKLSQITKDSIKNIPNSSVVNEKVTDRYNDITVSTISDSSANPALISGIAERFIRNGYPVYLVEVG